MYEKWGLADLNGFDIKIIGMDYLVYPKRPPGFEKKIMAFLFILIEIGLLQFFMHNILSTTDVYWKKGVPSKIIELVIKKL